MLVISPDAHILPLADIEDFLARTGVNKDFFRLLPQTKAERKRVAACGVASKGNTLLNDAGVWRDPIPLVGDRNPAKQGKCVLGHRSSIVRERRFGETRPCYMVILPRNQRAAVTAKLAYNGTRTVKLVNAVPAPVVPS